jgi:hypothetical protein
MGCHPLLDQSSGSNAPGRDVVAANCVQKMCTAKRAAVDDGTRTIRRLPLTTISAKTGRETEDQECLGSGISGSIAAAPSPM